MQRTGAAREDDASDRGCVGEAAPVAWQAALRLGTALNNAQTQPTLGMRPLTNISLSSCSFSATSWATSCAERLPARLAAAVARRDGAGARRRWGVVTAWRWPAASIGGHACAAEGDRGRAESATLRRRQWAIAYLQRSDELHGLRSLLMATLEGD